MTVPSTKSPYDFASTGFYQLVFSIIGIVESPFPDRRGTPRQPQLVPAAYAFIRFAKHIQHAHYAELAQFSHIWILFHFHENTSVENVKAKIRPPRLHGQTVGCLSTRSPHRPNAIGLSVCEVVKLEQNGIRVKCVDMVDGTPVLDGKSANGAWVDCAWGQPVYCSYGGDVHAMRVGCVSALNIWCMLSNPGHSHIWWRWIDACMVCMRFDEVWRLRQCAPA